MKYLWYIALIISFTGKAQLPAPSIRCLEVLNSNGDVRITWVAPSDPGGQFFGYDLYFSSSPFGPFTVVGSDIGPVTTTSFVHSTTVTTIQSGYYYMVTKTGATGNVISAPSDTLRTVFLNINTAAADALKLSFNHLSTPPLPTSSNTFLVRREYPPGNWQDLVITPLEFFNDTFNICNSLNYSINYLVSISDELGCTSVSNIQGGIYHDLHDPYLHLVDSISVLPNGQTILAWHTTRDADIVKFEIQKEDIEGKNVKIDSLNGSFHTSYLYQQTSATQGTLGLYVKAIDSCARGSIVDYAPTTMFLQHSYDKCNFTTRLNWNSYRWLKMPGRAHDELLEYRIYYSLDSGATFTRVAATTDTFFVHQNVDRQKEIMYFVRVINKRMTMTASSNRTGFFSGEVQAPDYLYIRTATVIKKNVVAVNILMDAEVASSGIELERSEDGQLYENIAFIKFTGATHYSFEDENTETGRKYYYYRCLVRDSCGNIRQTSNVARTILLAVRNDEHDVFTKHLSWTEYIGFMGKVKEYNIYRVVNDINSFERIGRTDSTTTTFTDNIEFAAPDGARIEYVVEAFEGYGNLYNIEETSLSNAQPVYMEGRIFIPNAFAPNGENKTWRPVTHFIDKREYGVTVIDRWGQVVFTARNDQEFWTGENCMPGIYTYLITYKNSRGEYQEHKGHVQLIR